MLSLAHQHRVKHARMYARKFLPKLLSMGARAEAYLFFPQIHMSRSTSLQTRATAFIEEQQVKGTNHYLICSIAEWCTVLGPKIPTMFRYCSSPSHTRNSVSDRQQHQLTNFSNPLEELERDLSKMKPRPSLVMER